MGMAIERGSTKILVLQGFPTNPGQMVQSQTAVQNPVGTSTQHGTSFMYGSSSYQVPYTMPGMVSHQNPMIATQLIGNPHMQVSHKRFAGPWTPSITPIMHHGQREMVPKPSDQSQSSVTTMAMSQQHILPATIGQQHTFSTLNLMTQQATTTAHGPIAQQLTSLQPFILPSGELVYKPVSIGNGSLRMTQNSEQMTNVSQPFSVTQTFPMTSDENVTAVHASMNAESTSPQPSCSYNPEDIQISQTCGNERQDRKRKIAALETSCPKKKQNCPPLSDTSQSDRSQTPLQHSASNSPIPNPSPSNILHVASDDSSQDSVSYQRNVVDHKVQPTRNTSKDKEEILSEVPAGNRSLYSD